MYLKIYKLYDIIVPIYYVSFGGLNKIIPVRNIGESGLISY